VSERTKIDAMLDSLIRESYGRLLAYLTLRWRDIEASEDALGFAFLAALEKWPQTGIPTKPDAWLLTVARNKLIDVARQNKWVEQLVSGTSSDYVSSSDFEAWQVPDERLRMMLICTHPAIDAQVRPALILQTVLGLDVKEFAPAFLLSHEAMTKRLVRAKKKIRESGLAFEFPDSMDLPERLRDLIEAIYAAYCLGHEGALFEGDSRSALRDEAVQLARIMASLLPNNAEALGFLALLLFCESRRGAQQDGDGNFVPLLEQDTRLWNSDMMREAYKLLSRSASLSSPGPFQIEAAIHAAHCYRARTGVVPWSEITVLYDSLIGLHPTVGAEVSRAVAYAYAYNAEYGLEILNAISEERICNYQPWWAARGHLMERLGETERALQAFSRALGLSTQLHIRRYITTRLRSLASHERP
jgi:RNA polymerase sigma-70 factor (ECF subfamily)